MTTRVQEKVCSQETLLARQPRISTLEKTMLRCAVFDPDDKVLDANVRTGNVADYLQRHMECEVCGISSDMEAIRTARARMYAGDFVYAAVGDIPWRDEAFDTILLHPTEGGMETLSKQLPECKRVLKPGGQLVLAFHCMPAPLRAVERFLLERADEDETVCTHKLAHALLEQSGFQYITHEWAGLDGHVLIAWKEKEAKTEQ